MPDQIAVSVLIPSFSTWRVVLYQSLLFPGPSYCHSTDVSWLLLYCGTNSVLNGQEHNKNGYERRARWHHWKYLRKSTFLDVYNLSMLVVCNMIRALLIHMGNYKPCCSDSIHEFLSWVHSDGKRIGGLGLNPKWPWLIGWPWVQHSA